MKKLSLNFLFTLLFFQVSAQQSEFGNWLIYFGNKQFNPKLNLHHEVQYRSYNVINDFEQLLIRSGIGYNLSENNNNILLGYGYILSENYTPFNEKVATEEHRIYQQFITKQQFGRVDIQHRYRIEERFIENQFKMRFRYFLSCKTALNRKKMEDKTLYLSLYNELFIGERDPFYDRNRSYAGLGYRFSNVMSVEFGYMNQHFINRNLDQLNCILSLNF